MKNTSKIQQNQKNKVENFLETGNVPEDRWFKNVFTKMKRAFGLSKDVDIIDITNLLKK